jgi:hypothetical protein
MREEKKKIKIQKEHIELLSHAYVEWCGDEFGAPQIDPERPYGNSDVIADMAEILGYVKGDYDDINDVLSEKQMEKLQGIHEDTQYVLQIILQHPTRSPRSLVGKIFKREDYSMWKLVK